MNYYFTEQFIDSKAKKNLRGCSDLEGILGVSSPNRWIIHTLDPVAEKMALELARPVCESWPGHLAIFCVWMWVSYTSLLLCCLIHETERTILLPLWGCYESLGDAGVWHLALLTRVPTSRLHALWASRACADHRWTIWVMACLWLCDAEKLTVYGGLTGLRRNYQSLTQSWHNLC